MNKKVLAIDFDGTLRKDENTVMPGALEAVEYYLRYFEVNVYAARSVRPGGPEEMRAWLKNHGFPVQRMKFPKGKPSIDALIDDQAYRFVGEWPSAARLLTPKKSCCGDLERKDFMDNGSFCGKCNDHGDLGNSNETGGPSDDCDQCAAGAARRMQWQEKWDCKRKARDKVLSNLSEEDLRALAPWVSKGGP